MAIGASLWGTANQTFDRNGALRKRSIVGTRTNYIAWTKNSPIFPKVGATGINVRNWQDAIIVNQVGKRFYNEMEDGYPSGTTQGFLNPYIPGDWRNATRIKYAPMNYPDAALAINEGSTPPDYAAGPQWAIFDAEAVKREKWNLNPPATHPDYFFSAKTLADLAALLTKCPYQKVKMPAANLEATVKRYNQMVDLGVDPDFAKPSPRYQDRYPSVLCGLGHDHGARHLCGPQDQHEVPGDGHEGPGHPGPLLRRRVGCRVQPAWSRPVHYPGLYCRQRSCQRKGLRGVAGIKCGNRS